MAAHLFSAGVELPNQGIAPATTIVSSHDHQLDDKKEDFAGVEVGEERPGDENVVHEVEMPEGPTTSKYEEWA
jgi:hypothetical protein